ncbi:response regulator transcription factor [Saccharibacillus sp. CPCC 101409]|uniref:response regulator transcription factor n=1 Tax=Saccharibacillus sp. CPCC 101409 TaxID=3058041 RepID=UPI00267150C3|nr:response regulator transcription factor [Saccharibacillus sp. CPCC 101409]MDO3412243.1 response regulator transcription factor [Saccharibacillus sp. CPCC 101409]
MKRTILLVEDDVLMREFMTDYFKKDSWNVLEAGDGREALELFELHEIDLIVLDIMMPEIDGWSVCRRVRKKSGVPIIIITARADDDDQIMGFELGADEYVTKPFSPKVLVARAAALLKRAEGTLGREEDVLSYGGITINKRAYTVEVDGESVGLSPKEYDLLLLLTRHTGAVLERDEILNAVWGIDYFGDPRAVDTHIKKLRAKLGGEGRHIRTVIGTGYKFEVEKRELE